MTIYQFTVYRYGPNFRCAIHLYVKSRWKSYLPILISRVESDRESLSRSLQRAVFYRLLRLHLQNISMWHRRQMNHFHTNDLNVSMFVKISIPELQIDYPL